MTDSPSAIDGWLASGADASEAPDGPEDARTYVTAFSRGLAVIQCFSVARPALTISDVAKAVGLNRATARRLLRTLEAEGYASVQDGRYTLRPRVLELGYAYLSSIPMDQMLRSDLTELANEVRQACSAATLDDHQVLFVARAETSYPRVMTLAHPVGSRMPAYHSALGRVLLAGLPDDRLDDYLSTVRMRKLTDKTITDRDELRAEVLRVRVKGFSLADEQVELGVRAVAVPVPAAEGTMLAIGAASNVPADVMEAAFVPSMKATAARIEQVLRLLN